MKRSLRLLARCLVFEFSYILPFLPKPRTITGNVRNSLNKDVVPAVSVTVKGTNAGTFTDEKGNFRFTTDQKSPLTLVFSFNRFRGTRSICQ